MCTEADQRGNAFVLGQLSELVNKGKRKQSYCSSSAASLVEIQGELRTARRKIAQHEEENARRRDEEQQQAQSRIYEMEKLITFMKNNDPQQQTQTASQTFYISLLNKLVMFKSFLYSCFNHFVHCNLFWLNT
ncbi:unnamed protein product [Arabis nemorensis]|uniref:Uncharacterized protein n=1 Tax=Arabis nemorensis TaxID=586526 RepID=A0A565BL79_9BRAS|nr:unnamed protein product [Arabis nemorensis]